MKRALTVVVALVVLGLIGLAVLFIADNHSVEASKARPITAERIERGRYLAVVGDCVACHTRPGGEPFAGGLALETPFGKIYSPNITPDQTTGIGKWTVTDIYRAMHVGKDEHGANLYPAFSYPYYTRTTREDAEDISAYLLSLQPVKYEVPKNEMKFPFNIRFLVKGWNLLHFRPGPFEADKSKSPEWNRGAYLVEGLGHCGACHTPKNAMFGDKMKQALQGGTVEHWFASDLTDNKRTGLGNWTEEEVVEFLQTGANSHSIAYGTMVDVIKNSTSQMTPEDLKAMAVYLKSIKGPEAPAAPKPAEAVMTAGQAVYAKQCGDCHIEDGTGLPGLYSPLAANVNMNAKDPSSIVHIILNGHPGASGEGMPGFAKLPDKDIAAVATYVRNSWGNSAPAVDEGFVAKLRKAVVKPAAPAQEKAG